MERIPPGRARKPISALELQQAMESDPSPSDMAEGPPGSSGVTGSSTTPFKCPICSKVFARRDQLYQHRYRVKCQPGPVFRKSRTPQQLLCSICDMGFTTIYGLRRHLKTIHSISEPSIPKPSPAPRLPKKKTLSAPSDYSKGVMIAQATRNLETGKYKCDLCQREFSCTSYLKDHINSIHFNQASYPCLLCSKVFRHRNDHWKHKRVHQGLTYPCPQCGKSFNQKRCLARHLRLKLCSTNINGPTRRPRGQPSLKPPVQCPLCGKNFNSSSEVNIHIKCVHEKVRDHLCPQCGKGFFSESGLQTHVLSVHERNRDLLCDLCGKGFAVNSQLQGHRRRVHPQPVEVAEEEVILALAEVKEEEPAQL